MHDLARLQGGLLRQDPTFRRQAAFVLIFNTLMLIWLAFHLGRHALHVAVDDSLDTLGPILMPLWCLGALLRQCRRESAGMRTRLWGPLCLSLGSLCYGLGMGIWTDLEVIRHQAVLFPSLADAAYLAAYPFLFLGVLMMPLRPVPTALRGRVLLDSLITMAALVTFSWYFVLGPTILADNATLLAKALGAGYPLADLALLFCVLMLSAHTQDRAMRPIIGILSSGLAVIVAVDTLYGYEGLQNTYATGGLMDVLWPIGYMLVVLAGGMVSRLPARPEVPQAETRVVRFLSTLSVENHDNPVLWRSLLPYVLVPMVGMLLWYTQYHLGDARLRTGVIIGAVVLVTLILIRQVFALLENNHLNQFLREAYTELEVKNRILAAANARLESLAVTDGLTGLKNHRAFQEQREREQLAAERTRSPLSLILLDVDRFKTYNDTFGHPAGDEVLKTVGQTLLDNARDTDFVARYGGEEFVILLPDADHESALAIAERFRAAIESAIWTRCPVTASFGVATWDGEELRDPDLVSRADGALYRAKYSGRNRVCHADQDNRAAVAPSSLASAA